MNWSDTRLKRAALLLSTLLLFSCHARLVTGRAPSLAQSIGIVSAKGGKPCLEIRNPNIAPNSRIRILNLLGDGSNISAGLGTEDPACGANSASDASIHSYAIQSGTEPLAAQLPAIGLLNYTGDVANDGNSLSADLDHDGQPEYFHSCASTEGIHFTAWAGKPLTGKLLWHQYYYLGYDVSPTCTTAETKED